jgi:two-component system, cell cycle sensor histidine kinase and response regulator CckA
LQQVITNLVLNARDAMNGKGTVMISARSQQGLSGGRASIAVRDTGSGMTPAILQHIFEPLYTTKRTGTGLGLAVALQVIQAHGGTIEVESTPGQGTTFNITLPMAATDGQSRTADIGSRRTSVQRIVLVEDEMAVAAGIVYLLESEGLSVRAVHTGEEALPVIEAFKPDVVILDMSLPDMHGTQVYQQIAEHYPSLPVILSSGHEDVSAMNFNRDGVAFLRKPYDFETLMATIEKISGFTSG